MNSSEQRESKHLLVVARRNLAASEQALRTVPWSKEVVAIAAALGLMRLAMNQTMNVLDNVIDDL